MRRLLLSLASAGAATMAIATSANAQWYPRPVYGYGYSWGEVQNLQWRVSAVQHRILALANRGQLDPATADRLLYDTRQLEWALGNGVNPYQARNIQYRLGVIEQRLRYSAYRFGNGFYAPY